jgi:glycosyltransferase involved in cell wall biosynthesis
MKFTIVTPSLNCATTLPGTLASMRGLIKSEVEHILVDSGSTDGTVELARDAGSQVIYHPRGNMYAAINAGLVNCKGEWMTYINGDDILYVDAINEALAHVPADVDVIYGDIDYIDEAGRFLFSWRCPKPQWLPAFMGSYSAVPQQGTLFRRRVFEKLGGFDTQFRYSADYDFWARALTAGFKFHKHAGKTMAGFRLLPTQLSQARKAEMAPEGIAIRDRLCDGQSGVARKATEICASLYRISHNIDNYWLRTVRGRGLDKR